MLRRTPFAPLLILCAGLALPLLMPGTAAANRADPWITFTTKITLLTAGGLDAASINVDTVQGLVTLHGRVDTAEQKAEAELLARQVDGVVEVRNLLQVMPDTKRSELKTANDAETKDALEKTLGADILLKDSSVKVASVTNGVVLLSGKATSLSDQLRAIELARVTPGVRHVASEIQGPSDVYDAELWHDGALTQTTATDGGPASAVQDAWITMATKLKLLANDKTPMGINVDTDNGIVTLFGTVPSEASKAAAEAEAASVGGVKSVRNELQVVSSDEKELVDLKDDQIQTALVAALKDHPELSGVSVDVKAGVARLSGKVKRQVDRLSAAVIARATSGVRSVLNDLTVDIKA